MITKSTTCDLIVEDLKEKILEGELKEGDKLPTERDLAVSYNVSRLPVREALRVLRELGFLETRHGKGTYIKSQGGSEFSKDVANYFLMNKDSVMEVFELRRILENDIARLAAQKGSEAEKKEISRSRERAEDEILKMKVGRKNEFLQADQEFHQAISRASHNTILSDIFNGIQEFFTIHQVISLGETEEIDDVIKYHRRLEQAICSGNEADAEKAMNSHMRRIEELLNQAIRKQA